MDQVNQAESSGTSSIQTKRRRGRPFKDPNLKHALVAHASPGFERKKHYVPRRAERTDGIDTMVGQEVTGVVEATFDAGYLLTVRIGNSNTNLRGVVFKPGRILPVTAEIDVAPHIPMIRRNDVSFPAEDRGQRLSVQTDITVPPKHKYTTPTTAHSIPPVGVQGTVVPVVLQPANLPNGSPVSTQMHSHTSQAPHIMAFENKDASVVEPLTMLAPDQSIPASQVFAVTQPHSTQVILASGLDDKVILYDSSGEFDIGEAARTMKSPDIDTPGSSQSLDIHVENEFEAWKSSPEDSGVVSKQEFGNIIEPFSNQPLQTAYVPEHMFNYGTGKMTELLMAVQENVKDSPRQMAEKAPYSSEVEFHEAGIEENTSKNEARMP